MAPRFFPNPYQDYQHGTRVQIPEQAILKLITEYVTDVLKHTHTSTYRDRRGDLYVGGSGIAYMFYQLSQSRFAAQFPKALKYAKEYIEDAKARARQHAADDAEKVSFLCGNAGIYAVSAAINHASGKKEEALLDIAAYKTGIPVCKNLVFNPYGNDEVLFGRAGYLSGIYWLNSIIKPEQFTEDEILSINETMFESGFKYAMRKKLRIPLMYECYGDQYLGAAHGVSAIYHMLLDSPIVLSESRLDVIREAVDCFLSLQAEDGNFPAALDEVAHTRNYHLVHWCHGAPGAIYVLAKAFLHFKSIRYLEACRACADLVWEKGLLVKGPGICHGIAGNGYVFLLMFRLTKEPLYLYRAIKFFEFLSHPDFLRHARVPDHPWSLYEGISGSICYLLDLLEPEKAAFPFMDVFIEK